MLFLLVIVLERGNLVARLTTTTTSNEAPAEVGEFWFRFHQSKSGPARIEMTLVGTKWKHVESRNVEQRIVCHYMH